VNGKPLGFLIEIEGLNGAGKTTLAKELTLALDDAVYVRFNKQTGVLSKVNSHKPTSLGMFLNILRTARTDIQKQRREHKYVIKDRGLLSEVTHLPNANRRFNHLLNKVFEALYPKPDLLVFLDVPPQVAYDRVEARVLSEARPTHPNTALAALVERLGLYRVAIRSLGWTVLTLNGQDQTSDLVLRVKEKL
jgi:thymidylate kinase